MSWQDDPVVASAAAPSGGGGGWQDDPVVGKAALTQQKAGPPQSMLHDIGNEIDSAFTLGGADWLTSKLPGGPPLSQLQATTQASHQRLPTAISAPIDIAGYAMGPGKLLGPAGAALGGAGLGGMAAEGALAGGLSSGFGSDFNPVQTVGGGAVGAGLGAAAGLIPKGVNAGLAKVLDKPGTVDPAAAIATTAKDTADAYAALHQKEVSPFSVNTALIKGRYNLSPSEETGLSGGFKSQFDDINKANDSLTLSGGKPTAGDVDSWQRQIQDAAVSSTDKIAAGKIRDNLTDVLKQHDAYGLQQDAKAAYQKSKMAENLADWQGKVSIGRSIGDAPLTEADKFYQGQPDKARALQDLYQTNQGMVDPSYSVGHFGGNVGAALGASIGGWGGAAIGYPAGSYLTKSLSKDMVKKIKTGNMLKALQGLYPSMTGVPLTGGKAVPQLPAQAGDLLKNLMLGGVY